MNVLAVHNFYKVRGGEDECYEAEVKLLREAGHRVDTYTETNDCISSLSKADVAIRTIWSEAAYQTVKQRLIQQTYDVVHIHNFFPLFSPSIYYAAHDQGVPIVQTLHNYRLLCPNALFFRNGSVCEDCLGKAVPYPGAVHGCYRESRAASAGVTAMLAFHTAKGTWLNKVDRYIALTEFARQKFIQGGLSPDKILVKPNFVDPDPGLGAGQGGYALYVGRLSVEKGLDTLLAAWEQLQQPLPLKIVGDGPLSAQVIEATKRLPHIQWLGRKPMSEVHALMGDAIFLVFPSKWYETFGRVAIESFAKGTPVIASNIGAIAELVESGRTGLLFEPANSQDLATKVEVLLANPEQIEDMRRAARTEFDAKYTAHKNYQQLIDIYSKAQSIPVV